MVAGAVMSSGLSRLWAAFRVRLAVPKIRAVPHSLDRISGSCQDVSSFEWPCHLGDELSFLFVPSEHERERSETRTSLFESWECLRD